ncbi:DNA adenine methylase [Richelia sinica FACHB-800]|nr:DNA adenine methylase [Richelia sinica]MBD2663820.1 DNA adenine methylase [Richelia sinica FACHB-800]
MNKLIKSPLRYPGGKSRVVKFILPHIPLDTLEFREPFIGGGSVFLGAKTFLADSIRKYWINDIYFDLYAFWQYAKDDIENLVSKIRHLKASFPDGRELYNFFKNPENLYSDFDRAVRFFIMNRITFSGIMDSGGYSQEAYEKRFTLSSISRLENLSQHLSDVEITCGDYEKLLRAEGDNVFIFLDPPYYQPTKSKLYGVKGNLHTSFDHHRFAENLKQCHHKWLLTYDDCAEIRDLFDFAQIKEFEVQYGMNNYKQKKAEKGKELLISNYLYI